MLTRRNFIKSLSAFVFVPGMSLQDRRAFDKVLEDKDPDLNYYDIRIFVTDKGVLRLDMRKEEATFMAFPEAFDLNGTGWQKVKILSVEQLPKQTYRFLLQFKSGIVRPVTYTHH